MTFREYCALPLRSTLGPLGRAQHLEQRIVQRAMLRLEMAEGLRVDGRDQQQAVAVLAPQLEIDLDEAVDRVERRAGARAPAPRRSLSQKRD